MGGAWFLQIVDIGNLNIKVKWKVVSPDSRLRDSGNLYLIIYKQNCGVEPVGGRS